jgi:hypothetical protein
VKSSYLNRTTIFQTGLTYSLAIYVDAVSTIQIFDDKCPALSFDTTVLTRDVGIFESAILQGFTTYQDKRLVQINDGPLSWSRDDYQSWSHGGLKAPGKINVAESKPLQLLPANFLDDIPLRRGSP